ncbi:unnamed protein product [Urochloa decumbens]|uniref:DUF295 domain-containing protein n=1 Tax=Urochloa decumbens TaxID=240449 RepID=A0ABC8VLF3_9POAL
MAKATPRAAHPLTWSDIPLDLAGQVLQLLPAYADRARFASVCPQWRAAARQLALPPPLPLLALPDGTFYSLPYGKRFHFPGFGCASYKGAACGSWLVFPRDDGCYLVDPFAKATVALPPLSRGNLYALVFGENLLNVNISQDPNTGNPQVSRIGQVIKGDPWYAVVYPDMIRDEKKLYLVESHGKLLMVRRKVWCKFDDDGKAVTLAGKNEFEVFEADLEHSRWINVTTLGDDQVIFLGKRCSRAVSASQYGISGDQIFFLDDIMENVVQYFFDGESTS